MAPITLFSWWGEEMKAGLGWRGVGCRGEGETQPAESWRSGGRWLGGWVHVYNGDALSAALNCTLSPIGTQIRASHYNHLHSDHCTVQRCHYCTPLYVAAVRTWRRSCPAAVHAQPQHQKGHLELHGLLCYTGLAVHRDVFQLEVASVASLRAQICLFGVLVVLPDKLCSTDEALCSSHSPAPWLPQHSFALMCCRTTQNHCGQHPVELICTRSHWHRRKLWLRGKGGCC